MLVESQFAAFIAIMVTIILICVSIGSAATLRDLMSHSPRRHRDWEDEKQNKIKYLFLL